MGTALLSTSTTISFKILSMKGFCHNWSTIRTIAIPIKLSEVLTIASMFMVNFTCTIQVKCPTERSI